MDQEVLREYFPMDVSLRPRPKDSTATPSLCAGAMSCSQCLLVLAQGQQPSNRYAWAAHAESDTRHV